MTGRVPGNQQQSVWRGRFEIISTIVMIGLAAILVWQGRGRLFNKPSPGSTVAVPEQPIQLVGRPTLGVHTAKVGMVIYSDFECPFCGKFAREVMPTLQSEFITAGKVVVAFKHFPLAFHALASGAAAAAHCAGQQGKFWQMHDKLFEPPLRLAPVALRAAAEDSGVAMDAYETCVQAPETARVILEDSTEATDFGLTGTPSFIIGPVGEGMMLQPSDVVLGTKPVAEFRNVLNRLLKSP